MVAHRARAAVQVQPLHGGCPRNRVPKSVCGILWDVVRGGLRRGASLVWRVSQWKEALSGVICCRRSARAGGPRAGAGYQQGYRTIRVGSFGEFPLSADGVSPQETAPVTSCGAELTAAQHKPFFRCWRAIQYSQGSGI